METKQVKRGGFTIVELLTVMAVIAVLIGLLIPALSLVKDNAKEIQQSAQFHAIDVGLELYKSEYGVYPESHDNLGSSTPAAVPPLADDSANYGGAQKLAEALVGWDLLGYHPKSGFRSDGENYFPASGSFTAGYEFVYDTTNGLDVGSYTEASAEENIKARTGPFLDLENANAYTMYNVYGTEAASGGFNEDNIVLCDVYAKQRTSGEKTGMPILYFRANTNYTFQNYYGDGGSLGDTDYTNDVYNFDDNGNLIYLQTAESVPQDHEIMRGQNNDEYENFEKIVVNEQVVNTSGIYRPYRANSYILISAGKDGNYGTADDVMNFGRDTKE